MVNLLLIDDDKLEEITLSRLVKRLKLARPVFIKHVYKCSEAIDWLLRERFDLILLDNLLAASISGKFSVPIIKQYVGDCPLVIISNDIEVDYLEDPRTLGVDAVIDKKDLDEFIADFFATKQSSIQPRLADASPFYTDVA